MVYVTKQFKDSGKQVVIFIDSDADLQELNSYKYTVEKAAEGSAAYNISNGDIYILGGNGWVKQ